MHKEMSTLNNPINKKIGTIKKLRKLQNKMSKSFGLKFKDALI